MEYKDGYSFRVVGAYGGSLELAVASLPRATVEASHDGAEIHVKPGSLLYMGNLGVSPATRSMIEAVPADIRAKLSLPSEEGLDQVNDVFLVANLELLEATVRKVMQRHFEAPDLEDSYAEFGEKNVREMMREVKAEDAARKVREANPL